MLPCQVALAKLLAEKGHRFKYLERIAVEHLRLGDRPPAMSCCQARSCAASVHMQCDVAFSPAPDSLNVVVRAPHTMPALCRDPGVRAWWACWAGDRDSFFSRACSWRC